MTPQMTKMLMRCTRRATASTNSMAAMAPAKRRQNQVVREFVNRPRFKKTTIVSATASLAPLEMPMTNGPAMGLAKKVCSRYPATDKRRPQQHDHDGARQAQLQQDVAGQYILPAAQQGRDHVRAGESATLPQNRLSANSASRAAAMARYAIVRRFRVCMRGSLCGGRQWCGRIWNPPLRFFSGYVRRGAFYMRPFLPPC